MRANGRANGPVLTGFAHNVTSMIAQVKNITYEKNGSLTVTELAANLTVAELAASLTVAELAASVDGLLGMQR